MEYRLSDDWRDIKNIIIFGFGKTAKGNIDHLIDEFHVEAIIDNDEKYVVYKHTYRGVPILNFKNCDIVGKKIIILAAGKALQSIKNTLVESGRQEYIDFVDIDVFATEWYLRFQNKLCLGKVTTSVTTRCTFNCKNCNMLMPYYRKPSDYDIEMLKRDADIFFSLVDFVTSFVIIGGEPFMYTELESYIAWLGKYYGKRIGNIQVITNGSIVPSDKLLKTIRKYNCEVRLSNYTEVLPYSAKYQQVLAKLEHYEIKKAEFVQKEWIDFGFPHDGVNMGDTPEKIREHMLKCHGMCHWLHDGKYYFCSNAWSAQECELFTLTENQDYIDLNKIIQQDNARERMLDFHLGNMEKGFMNFCKVCRGFESNVMVKAAIQKERK